MKCKNNTPQKKTSLIAHQEVYWESAHREIESLKYFLVEDPDKLTTAHGAPVGDKLNSLSVGPRGPLLLQDHVLIEELAHFDRERIPERVVHAKGAGAFGYFEVG